ncbi:hypothetical protein BDN71DRAFT_1457916 [Pleurotus eryngii]|uniref:Uncharacterized protein n=1 Tax=Pleurotus eryngii TaxID=5323 RepID=A0A9P6D8S4_PLEER|nr:hypothetical protein BDN71DRAFT_1457916 [Pleurotus eryngii]
MGAPKVNGNAIYTAAIDAAWKDATDEQKEEVYEALQKAATEPTNEEEEDIEQPCNMEQGIKHLPLLMNMVARDMHECSGWYFTILAGGRNLDGKAQVARSVLGWFIITEQTDDTPPRHSYHLGKTMNGNNFEQTYGNFKTAVMKPWTMFVRNLVGKLAERR